MLLPVLLALFLIPAPDTSAIDRHYTLEASILGYRGVGGAIDGIRNPVLRAAPGEQVRITILGVELMPHDVALEKADVRSPEVLDVGDVADLVFTASESDVYYCSIPGHRAAGMEGRLEVGEPEAAVADVAGVVPERDGRPANMGFENGTWSDWSATGDAFGDGPVEGDVVSARMADTRSRHTGTFWASSGEVTGPRSTGTLTSRPFPVTHPYASFLVAGGALEDTRVEIVRAEDDSVLFRISGTNHPSLRPVVVDLTGEIGRDVFIRLIDDETGISDIPYIADHRFAYISFDDFRFHATRPSFEHELTPADIQILPPLDYIPHAGLSGEAAAAAMTVPDGFEVILAASEPEIVRPIAFAIDDRGRLWVVEANTYPVRAPEGEGRDRLYIFEDTDGDGTLDHRKLVMDDLNLVSGMEVGFGGVWIGAAPYLQFIPIDPETDEPTGEPQILLDGWGYEDTHETLNSFQWGPDGWLYGTHGVFVESNVGPPGTPDDQRAHINAGVWRYHPTRHIFERFIEGTSNPWGLDFDAYGQGFITACVIPHLYHTIQGGRFERQANWHDDPFIYEDIDTHADHVHWVGTYGPHAGNNRSDAAGGGHAHSGAMIYQGGTWPDTYQGRLFMNNIHGARLNTDVLEPAGSGYVGRHGEDFLFANDSWSQLLDLQYGPDGSVYVTDWYDKNQCHSPNPDVHQKTLGRIFKVRHENDRWVQVDLRSEPSTALVAYQRHENAWYANHARRLLQERGPDPAVHTALRSLLRDATDVTHRLRALWSLHVTEGLDDAALVALLDDREPHVRAWAAQLLAEDRAVPSDALTHFARMAREDPSPVVRLRLASALQRLPVADRWETLAGLYTRSDDADDHNLPLMIWYAAKAAVPDDPQRALSMALETKLPYLLPHTVRRIAALGTPEAIRILAEAISRVDDRDRQVALLEGLNLMLTE